MCKLQFLRRLAFHIKREKHGLRAFENRVLKIWAREGECNEILEKIS
jgi:hypothetical protein